MKLRLFLFAGLFLFLASTLLAGNAAAQASCITHPQDFPTPGGSNQIHNTAFCIEGIDSGGNVTARLRWNNSNSGFLQLFDTDEANAPLLWCAKDSMGNCAKGSSLCLQHDGNLVIYDEQDCQGNPLWASNTNGQNEDLERLGVREVSRTGEESAYISNDAASGSDEGVQFIWQSNP